MKQFFIIDAEYLFVYGLYVAENPIKAVTIAYNNTIKDYYHDNIDGETITLLAYEITNLPTIHVINCARYSVNNYMIINGLPTLIQYRLDMKFDDTPIFDLLYF